MFSCEFCEISKSTFFIEHLWATASKFLTTENPLKMMKYIYYFYFMLKALFVLKIYKLLSWLFGHVGKWFDLKAKFNFKIYDVTEWTTYNYNTYIPQYLRSKGNQDLWTCQLSVNRIQHEKYFSSRIEQKMIQGDEIQISFFKQTL